VMRETGMRLTNMDGAGGKRSGAGRLRE
jgi:hypothetical protein